MEISPFLSISHLWLWSSLLKFVPERDRANIVKHPRHICFSPKHLKSHHDLCINAKSNNYSTLCPGKFTLTYQNVLFSLVSLGFFPPKYTWQPVYTNAYRTSNLCLCPHFDGESWKTYILSPHGCFVSTLHSQNNLSPRIPVFKLVSAWHLKPHQSGMIWTGMAEAYWCISKCFIVGNWTCFSFLKTFHLSSKRLLRF